MYRLGIADNYVLMATQAAVPHINVPAAKFDGNNVFQEISTRNGVAVLQKSQQQTFPINCVRVEKDMKTENFWTVPIRGTDMWIQSKNREDFTGRFSRVRILQHQQPRQGMNSCQLNKVFIFEREYDRGSSLAV